MSRDRDSGSLAKLGESVGIELPEGTTLIRSEHETSSDELIRAKLIFTPSQWERFVAASPLDPAAFTEEQRYLLGADIGWWNPQDSEELPTAQASLPGAKVLNVGVDRSDPQRFLVFLVWHGT